MPYSKEADSHENLLKKLCERTLDESDFISENTDEEDKTNLRPDENLKTKAWQRVGFQSADPRTDFRAGGLLSLVCLFYFVQEHKRDFNEIKENCLEKEDFYLAISSINLTSYLQSYFYMNRHMNMP